MKQWVLIRGIMSEAFHWGDFFHHLKDRFPQDQFHTPDILGNGRHFQHMTPLNPKKNIQALRSQVPNQGKKILVGFSLGGMLSLEWAHHHPEEVAAVVLINCSLNNSPVYKRITPFSLKNIVHSAFQSDMKKREEMILRMTTARLPEPHIQKVATHWGPRTATYPPKSINFFSQLLVAAQIPQRPQPPAPVLILASQKDKVVHPDCSKKIAAKWQLPLISHPEAGHDLTLDDPHWVLDQVQSFIAQKVQSKTQQPLIYDRCEA